jgi:hypothetical protein
VVLTLVDRLREAHPSLPFTVVTDNFFTTHKLFSELREWGVGAFGTTKQGTHDFANDPSEWKSARKRPRASLTHGKPDVSSNIPEIEENQSFLLPFPQLAVDYNRDINRADLCAQLWSYYSTANHRHRRNWWPLLWGFLNNMVTNTAKIYHRLRSKLTHRDI